MPHVPEPTYRCPKCQDTGWIEVSNQRVKPTGVAPIHMPCNLCNPIRFRRWEEGHYAKEHNRGSCAECIAIAQHAIGDGDMDEEGRVHAGVLGGGR